MLIPEVKKLMVKPFNEFYVVQPWSIDNSLWGNQICFSRYSTLVTKELRLSLLLSFSMLENFKINMLSTSSFPHFFLSLPMS